MSGQSTLRAYRLIITHYEYAPPQLWEWEQPHIDNLYRSARTFGHHMKQRFFLNKDALNCENALIWHTHYKPKPAHDHIASWQELLAEHRQVVAEVLEIAAETGWRGPEREAPRCKWRGVIIWLALSGIS